VTRAQWTEVMKPFYQKPMKTEGDAQAEHLLLSDSLASVDDVVTMTQGGKTTTARNSMFVIRGTAKWRVKPWPRGLGRPRGAGGRRERGAGRRAGP